MFKKSNLKNLYNAFIKFKWNDFVLYVTKYGETLKDLNLSKKILQDVFDNYYKSPFLIFLKDIKTIIYSKTIFDFITKNSAEDWDLSCYLQFLVKEKIIKINDNGKILILNKELINLMPRPQNEDEIKFKIEKKLKVKIKENESVNKLFQNRAIKKILVKSKWDQMPISQGSAIFLVNKILKEIPFYNDFLFVGDDDFISVLLGLANPKIESLVVDIDDQLLNCIDKLAKNFKLKIKTKKVDVRKKIRLEGNFIGFLTNPPYTADGVKEFMKYGINQLSKDGGVVFLEVGDEAIGNQFLFLQDFFTKNNLVIKELIKGKIFYPHIMLYKEDKEIMRRFLSLGVKKEIIKKSPRLGVSLYIFHYFAKTPEKVNFKKPIYAYL